MLPRSGNSKKVARPPGISAPGQGFALIQDLSKKRCASSVQKSVPLAVDPISTIKEEKEDAAILIEDDRHSRVNTTSSPERDDTTESLQPTKEECQLKSASVLSGEVKPDSFLSPFTAMKKSYVGQQPAARKLSSSKNTVSIGSNKRLALQPISIRYSKQHVEAIDEDVDDLAETYEEYEQRRENRQRAAAQAESIRIQQENERFFLGEDIDPPSSHTSQGSDLMAFGSKAADAFIDTGNQSLLDQSAQEDILMEGPLIDGDNAELISDSRTLEHVSVPKIEIAAPIKPPELTAAEQYKQKVLREQQLRQFNFFLDSRACLGKK